MSNFIFSRSCLAALAGAAVLFSGHAVSGVTRHVAATAFGQLENQSPAEGLPNFFVQPKLWSEAVPLLRVSMMSNADKGNPAALTRADFLLACGDGSESLFDQVKKDKGAPDHRAVFRTWGVRTGKPQSVTSTRLWKNDKTDEVLVVVAQHEVNGRPSMEALVRLGSAKALPRHYAKVTDDLVKYATMVATNVAPKHGCKYAPPFEEVDNTFSSMVKDALKIKDTKVTMLSVVDGKGTPFEVVLGGRFSGPQSTLDEGIPAKLALFGDIRGVFNYKTTGGFVSLMSFSSPPNSVGKVVAEQGDEIMQALFERLGKPEAELVDYNFRSNDGKGERRFMYKWSSGVQIDVVVGWTKKVEEDAPVTWRIDFAYPQ